MKYCIFSIATTLFIMSGCISCADLRINYYPLQNVEANIPNTDPTTAQLLYGNDMGRNETYYREKGFVPIGYVRYIGSRLDNALMLRFINEQQAALGIYYFGYAGTRNANFQITAPTATTQTGTFSGNSYGSYGTSTFSGQYTGTTYGTTTYNVPVSVTKYDQTLMLYRKKKQSEIKQTLTATNSLEKEVLNNQLKAWGYKAFNEQGQPKRPTLEELMARSGETNRNEFIKRRLRELKEESEIIKAEQDKINSAFSDEQKRKQNEALKALGY